MPGAFFSKKRKREMLARKKKKKATQGDDDHDSASNQNHDETTNDEESKKEENQTHSYIVNKDEQLLNGTLVVRIPSGLDAQQQKKFRKDARRKARKRQEEEQQQQSTFDEILFLDEESPLPENLIPLHTPPRKKSKKNFHSINDLVAADKLAKAQKVEKKKTEQSLSKLSEEEKSQYIGLDCEMVGVGPAGKQSALARVSLTNFEGDIIMDSFVQVMERVTDFRTYVSGVRAKDIKANKNKDALDFKECRLAVGKLLVNKILVGHALQNDLKALMIDHPKKDIRDTAKFADYMKVTGKNGGKLRPRKLKDLSKEKLGLEIQKDGEAHSSVDDARAAMELYKLVRSKWEKEIAVKYGKFGGKK